MDIAGTSQQILDFLSFQQDLWQIKNSNSALHNAELEHQVQGFRQENARLRKAMERQQAETAGMSGFQAGEIVHLRTVLQKNEAHTEREKEKHVKAMEDLKVVVKLQRKELEDLRVRCRDEVYRSDERWGNQEDDNFCLWAENWEFKMEIQRLQEKMDKYLVPISIRAD